MDTEGSLDTGRSDPMFLRKLFFDDGGGFHGARNGLHVNHVITFRIIFIQRNIYVVIIGFINCSSRSRFFKLSGNEWCGIRSQFRRRSAGARPDDNRDLV
jgi:hypothetical protein